MLSSSDFVRLVVQHLKRDLNVEQAACVEADLSPLLIIAGPGTGKTTVLVLRALRHILVDAILPQSIVITTFTKKAAQEIRTRWLDWGLPLLELARKHRSMRGPAEQAFLDRVDLNHCVTGTLDSICEEMLEEYRPAGTVTPVLIEGYPCNQLLLQSGLQASYYSKQDKIDGYLANYTFDGEPPRTLGDLVKTVRPLLDRLVHDRVDVAAYRKSTPHKVAKEALAAAHEAYCAQLSSQSQLDFALLEQEFMDRLKRGLLDEGVRTWKAILVDEYQDTNPLQEEIYFELIRRTGASLSVVGDDDQSLYRFRGATVELFTSFVKRLRAATRLKAQTQYLKTNYRSTPEIITFFNHFVAGDHAFTSARIKPAKPAIAPQRASLKLPILGMFRESSEELATDLSELLVDVFRNGGREIHLGSRRVTLSGHTSSGDFGDAVVLSHSIQEYGQAVFGNPPAERFARHLRQELGSRGVGVFNPRGQALADQPSVQTLLGLALECLDRSSPGNPEGAILPTVKGLTGKVRNAFAAWRVAANAFIASKPAPGGLKQFVDAWNKRINQTESGSSWPDEWPFLELCFKLLSWLPSFREDPEHQVWLEAISRAAAQSRLFSKYGGQILNQTPHDLYSRSSIIRDVLRPVADGLVEVDEDLIPSVPRGRLSLMTIHQAKGLEFPLVIVDISSSFKTNHAKTAGTRFPSKESNVTRMEDSLAPFTGVGTARLARPALDRTFDDLMRLYYVAYSRAQTALLLIGHEKTIAAGGTVKCVSSGWCRDGSWRWHNAKGDKTTIANALPLELI